MQHARPNRLRRAVIYAALATMLGVLSLTLSQCTLVGDNLTGVDLTKATSKPCKDACKAVYNLYLDQESRYNFQINRLCGLSYDACVAVAATAADTAACQADSSACYTAERARHAQALIDIQNIFKQCKDACKHAQGTGSAG